MTGTGLDETSAVACCGQAREIYICGMADVAVSEFEPATTASNAFVMRFACTSCLPLPLPLSLSLHSEKYVILNLSTTVLEFIPFRS